jgi:arginase
MAPQTGIQILGVPMDLGANRRGVDMGPSAMRVAGVVDRLNALGYPVEDQGNVRVPQRECFQGPSSDTFAAIVDVCENIARFSANAFRQGDVPLLLGGDHSLSAGSVAGISTAVAADGGKLGLVWLDAHADINTPETSETGNIHGMPVAHLLGYGDDRLVKLATPGPAISVEHLVYVGIRSLDEAERAIIRQAGIRAFTIRDIDERGLSAVMSDAIAIASTGTRGIHLSCDVDWIDPSEAPGVGTPVRGGATRREAHLAMEMIADSGRLVGMDVVEVNPTLDQRNATAELAVDLIASAFGRSIL